MGKIKVTHSSGNVFLDIGFPPKEAERLLQMADKRAARERMFKRRNKRKRKPSHESGG